MLHAASIEMAGENNDCRLVFVLRAVGLYRSVNGETHAARVA